MAITSGGECHCKVTHVENGRVTVRRVHQLMIQRHDGRLFSLTRDQLPDAINIYSATPDEGQVAEVLLGAPRAPTLSSLAVSFLNGSRARDLGFMIVGMFVATGLSAVADVLARILNP